MRGLVCFVVAGTFSLVGSLLLSTPSDIAVLDDEHAHARRGNALPVDLTVPVDLGLPHRRRAFASVLTTLGVSDTNFTTLTSVVKAGL